MGVSAHCLIEEMVKWCSLFHLPLEPGMQDSLLRAENVVMIIR